MGGKYSRVSWNSPYSISTNAGVHYRDQYAYFVEKTATGGDALTALEAASRQHKCQTQSPTSTQGYPNQECYKHNTGYAWSASTTTYCYKPLCNNCTVSQSCGDFYASKVEMIAWMTDTCSL